MILKINENDNENIIQNMHEFRENVLYLFGIQRVVREDVDKVRNDDIVINSVFEWL